MMKERISSLVSHFGRKNMRNRKITEIGLLQSAEGKSRIGSVDRHTDEMAIMANSLISLMIRDMRPEFRWTTLIIVNISENSDDTNRHIQNPQTSRGKTVPL